MGKTISTAGSLIIAVIVSFAFSGCGGGGSSNSIPIATQTVSGVAAGGAPMSGTAFLKDAGNNPELSTNINAQNGSFSFNVFGRTAPFMIRAGSIYSMSGGPGIANINPLSNLMVADMGRFRNISSLNSFYQHPNGATMRSMFANFSTARFEMRQKMGPLFNTYGVPNADPMSAPYTIGQGLDRMFDDVKMIIDANGNVGMGYVSGTPVYTGQMGNVAGGTMMTQNIMMPGSIPASGITITPSFAHLQTGATQQFSASIPVTWSVTVPNGGTISTSGLYTAPSVQGMFVVKATSVADPTKSATVTISVGSQGMMM
jgi:hypothetical protein